MRSDPRNDVDPARSIGTLFSQIASNTRDESAELIGDESNDVLQSLAVYSQFVDPEESHDMVILMTSATGGLQSRWRSRSHPPEQGCSS